MTDSGGYRNIFKTTFLLGFVQVFNVVVKIGINKMAAVLLGAGGLGIISLFQTSILMFKTGAGLGISQSAVRDISEAYGGGNRQACSETISAVKIIIRFTSFLGLALMAALSPVLSHYSFGDGSYTLSYLLLSVAVAIAILTEGMNAILTGTRKLRLLAKAGMMGAFTGLITALPFYFLWGKQGIVPSLILSSLVSLLISCFFVRKVDHTPLHLPARQVFARCSSMIKMGISLMLLSFMAQLISLIVSGYISHNGGLGILGYYQSGITIITAYFGIIITAMTTDYYPRISAINKDNARLNDAVNAQSEIGMLMVSPLAVMFVLFSPCLLSLLYTKDFVIVSQYTDYAILGSIVAVCSNSVGMVLLAKQRSKLFLTSSLAINAVVLVVYISLYRFYGLTGLGIGYFFSCFLQLFVYGYLMKTRFSIGLSRPVMIKMAVALSFALLSKYAREIEPAWMRYLAGGVLFIAAGSYSLYHINRKTDIKLLTAIKNVLKKII